jgi:hypothetical protein
MSSDPFPTRGMVVTRAIATRRFIAVMLIVFGSLSVVGTILWTIQDYGRRDWPSTVGHIVSATASTKITTDTDSSGKRRTTTDTQTNVAVSYRAFNKDYSSAVFVHGDATNSFPPGAAHSIWFDPADPTHITLNAPDPVGSAHVGGIIGGAFLIVGALLWRFPRSP